jgi:hypothetical protein
MNTKNISWSKGSQGLGLTIVPYSCAGSVEIWDPQHPANLMASPGL